MKKIRKLLSKKDDTPSKCSFYKSDEEIPDITQAPSTAMQVHKIMPINNCIQIHLVHKTNTYTHHQCTSHTTRQKRIHNNHEPTQKTKKTDTETIYTSHNT